MRVILVQFILSRLKLSDLQLLERVDCQLQYNALWHRALAVPCYFLKPVIHAIFKCAYFPI